MDMRKLAIAAFLPLLLLVMGMGTAQAQINVTVDPVEIVYGYMNVFNLPEDGGAFQFDSGWGLPDLTAVWAMDEITLGPNTIGDINEYWYQCVGDSVPPNCGGPGAPGNKIMEANCYAQVDDGSFAGQTLTFSGIVQDTDLTDAHVVIAFIKDFAPDFSSFVQEAVVLDAVGPFSISLATINDPARHVQYGFQMTGVNVWVTDVDPFGTITIGPFTPVGTENATWGSIKSLLSE
jgi:hypothetical protein